MPSSRIRVSPSAREFDMKLKLFSRKYLEDLTKPNKEVAVWLMRWVDKNFKREGLLRYPGAGWEPFKLGGRRRKGGEIDATAKLLQDTGRLRASFSPLFSKKMAGVGSDLTYSEAHEKGKGVPTRAMLPTRDLVHSDIKRIYNAYFGKVVERKVL